MPTASPPSNPNSRSWLSLLLASAAGFLLALWIIPADFRNASRQGGTEGDRRESSDPTRGASSTTDPGVEAIGARLVVSTGDVQLRNANVSDWKNLDTASPFSFEAGTELRTLIGARCEVETTHGCTIRLNQDAEIAVRSRNEIELRAGKIWCRAPAQSALQVVASTRTRDSEPTPEWYFTCPSNAALQSEVGEEGQLRVLSAAGEIECVSNEVRRLLRSGEAAEFSNGKLALEPHRADALLATSWMQSLLTHRGHDGEELVRRIDMLLANVGRSKLATLYEDEIRGLGEYCVLPLIKFVQSPMSLKDVEKRMTAMRIVGDVAPTWSIGELIELLADDEPQVRVLSAAALRRLTGQTLGREPEYWALPIDECLTTHQAWKEWWDKHQFRYRKPASDSTVKLG